MKNILVILTLSWATVACNSTAKTKEKVEEARQAAIDSVNQVVEVERVKQATIDSMNMVKEEALVQEKEEAKEEIREAELVAANKVAVANKSSNDYSYTPKSSTSKTTTSSTPAKKKKKMNNTAKGALIGAGVGAVTGAVVSKKKGQGAIVGGLLGAGAGAVTGDIIDNQKEKKPKQ